MAYIDCMNIQSFDLNLLKTFHALLSEGSTVKAAEKLGLSQPAVSAALGRLRHAFDDPLFVRTGQRLEPTTVALALRPEVDKVMANLNGLLHRDAQFDPARASGTIWLSGSDFFSDLLLPDLLETIRLSAPNLRIVMVDQVFGSSLEGLERGQIDIAFWPDQDWPRWINRQTILTTQFEMIARRGHPQLIAAGVDESQPLPLDLVCALSHVHFSPDGRTQDDFDQLLAKQGRKRRIIATVPTFAAVYAITRRSDVIGSQPSHVIDSFGPNRDFTRHPLPLARPEIPLAMLWNRKTDHSPLHIWLRDQIAGCFKALDAAESPAG
jgi:DNA-binding transcriptional LysR family regulator